MKQLFLGLALGLGFVLATQAANVAAKDSDSGAGSDSVSSSSGSRGVPELDAAVTGSAMVLLLGGVAYLASRRRQDD
jgi:hypothetical protein